MNIRLDKVSKSFVTTAGSMSLFNGVSVAFDQGKTYAITGPSGAGKTTLLHIIAGLIEPTQGAVFLDNHNLSLMDTRAREQFLNRTVGLLFQNPYLIKELTVLENVMLKGLIAGRDQSDCKEEAMGILVTLALQDKMYEKPPVLSGGQQQRVALARAIFGKPSFLLADEPTGNLDPQTGKTLVQLLLDCQQRWSMGVIVSTHDAYVFSSMQIVYELQNGMLKQKQA